MRLMTIYRLYSKVTVKLNLESCILKAWAFAMSVIFGIYFIFYFFKLSAGEALCEIQFQKNWSYNDWRLNVLHISLR